MTDEETGRGVSVRPNGLAHIGKKGATGRFVTLRDPHGKLTGCPSCSSLPSPKLAR